MRITRNLILSFLLSALLVGCSTSLKPLKFSHGRVDTNVPSLFQSSLSRIHFKDGKETTNAPLILHGEQKRGAELLIAKPLPKVTKIGEVNLKPAKPPRVKLVLTDWIIFYLMMGGIVWWAYHRFIKSLVTGPRKKLPPSSLPPVQ